ncbi:MAG: hypothetical protein JRL30_19225 [Deltaproteobacteria bacterium]|nr:hypothetical protein [Deltaproteobacteria bacterium]
MRPEERNSDPIKSDIERERFVRAAFLAEQMGLPEEEIRHLRYQALGQMAVVYRNALGTKGLALQYGFSRQAVSKVLEEFADKMKKEGNTKPLDPCYDYRTGRYLSLEEWVEHYLKVWDKLSA